MMILDAIDLDTLPAEMLPVFKQHARIEHDRDDELCRGYLAMAIQQIERRANIAIFNATYVLRSDVAATFRCVCLGATTWRRTPVNNVWGAEFVPDDTAQPPTSVPVLASALVGNDESFVDSANVQTVAGVLQLNVGAQGAGDISPAVNAAILRIAASYYENREAPLAITADTFEPEVMSVWRPTA